MNWVKNWYHNVVVAWQECSKNEAFRRYFTLNFFMCLALYFAIIHWVKINSARHGAVLDDPLYHLLMPRDFSTAIFILTYSPVFIFLLWILRYPLLLHRALDSFVAVFIIRAVCIHFIPLSPAPGIIVLNDPISNAMADESQVLNDLFFSGHIGDLATLFFLCGNKWLRRYIFASAAIVALLLVWQRVHYSVDVLTAPFFSYLCYYAFVQKDIIWSALLKKPELTSPIPGFST